MDRRWILGGLLFAGGVGVVRAITYRPKLDENSRILLIGDSFAVGLAPHFNALASDDDLPFLGGGIVGTRVDQWADSDWLEETLEIFEPTHVLISLGGNDAYTNKAPAEVRVDTEDLVQLIRDVDAHPIWIGAPELPDVFGGREPNEEVLDAIQSAAPYYFDSTSLDIPRSPDELHPTARGYAGWAGAVWGWLT